MLDYNIVNTYNFFVDDAFVGSSAIRDAVGSMFSAVIVNKKRYC